jgi:hypothetical protein
MNNPVVIEAWLRLMQETMQGAGRAQETLRGLGEAWKSPEELNRWMESVPPLRSGVSSSEEFREWMQEWWKMMGVVPRSQYLELLERYDVLRTRLEEAEATIQRLRATLGVKGQEKQANEILDHWETATHAALKAQSEWLRTWTDISGKSQEPT